MVAQELPRAARDQIFLDGAGDQPPQDPSKPSFPLCISRG